MTNSTRYKLMLFVTIVLSITGVGAYLFDPSHLDKFAFYTINLILPIVTYIAGRTIRSGGHEKGLVQKSTRFKTAFYSFIGSLLIGIGCYIWSPENIDKLGMYMIGVIFPVMSYILGRSFKGATKEGDSQEP